VVGAEADDLAPALAGADALGCSIWSMRWLNDGNRFSNTATR
jgi:hypothetical protein